MGPQSVRRSVPLTPTTCRPSHSNVPHALVPYPPNRPRSTRRPTARLVLPIQKPLYAFYTPSQSITLRWLEMCHIFKRRAKFHHVRAAPVAPVRPVRPRTSFYPPRRLCTRFIRRPSLPHYDGSKRVIFLNVVRKKYVHPIST